MDQTSQQAGSKRRASEQLVPEGREPKRRNVESSSSTPDGNSASQAASARMAPQRPHITALG